MKMIAVLGAMLGQVSGSDNKMAGTEISNPSCPDVDVSYKTCLNSKWADYLPSQSCTELQDEVANRVKGLLVHRFEQGGISSEQCRKYISTVYNPETGDLQMKFDLSGIQGIDFNFDKGKFYAKDIHNGKTHCSFYPPNDNVATISKVGEGVAMITCHNIFPVTTTLQSSTIQPSTSQAQTTTKTTTTNETAQHMTEIAWKIIEGVLCTAAVTLTGYGVKKCLERHGGRGNPREPGFVELELDRGNREEGFMHIR